MNQIRQDKIRELISRKEIITIEELRGLFPEVSLMTLHRDLDVLAESGELVKIRGGARTVKRYIDPGFEERRRENLAAKAIVAKKALPLIKPGNAIFLDSGTTMMALAKAMTDTSVTVFTTEPNIAVELLRLPSVSVNLCGGNLNRHTLALSGYSTIEMLEKINLDIAFLAVSGCSPEQGFTCGQESEMMVKRAVIKRARKSAALFDRAKLSRLMPFTFARLNEVDYIISDGPLPKSFATMADEMKVKIF